ncbi:MAG: TA system VapC family ribonuclease toxin [Bryobacteraceae bacterium]|nr:TA system VapC family ribonuclease toxin [Bryobacteraceae bacterium]
MMYLVDVNVWLALVSEGHVHQKTAKAWFERLAAGSALFCRLSELSLLRLSTNANAMGVSAPTPQRAWEILETLLADERVREAAEPDGLMAHMRAITAAESAMSGSSWTDAYLAAFAIAGGYALATFDKRIAKRYPVKAEIVA